ncbi:hypothetical protein BH23GEM9_BH23GEM9_33800 [soil metagenome]
METHLAFCAALDREVRVYLRLVQYDETDPDIVETPALICLEHAEECAGICCPLFDVPLDSSIQRYEWFYTG